MDVDQILENHGLTRDTATQYIDAITRKNQSQTAEELDVSRDTINRYKNEFARMNEKHRTLVIATLLQEKHLEKGPNQ
jgi:DNA-binding XRE family transcriptional regulator